MPKRIGMVLVLLAFAVGIAPAADPAEFKVMNRAISTTVRFMSTLLVFFVPNIQAQLRKPQVYVRWSALCTPGMGVN